MQSSERQERTTQFAAWVWVVVVHAGLFWLLIHQGRESDVREDGPRLRLVFIATAQPDVLPDPAIQPSRRAPAMTAPAAPTRSRPSRARPSIMLPSPSSAQATDSTPDTAASTGALLEQGRQWTREQAPPAFNTDPFRSRHAQLPGGERPDSFRMKEPLSPVRVVGFIARAFGDRDPCPNNRSRLSGLLTATSEQERKLLQEELRRDRDYCRP
ncbi:MAG TPA: hypothetical protein VET30_11405 [Pseudoxanthomonas sp.]|nr:hypothetical protein [Pseudoxanthomonas sp.]